jgi:hypothetical protein
MLMDEEIKINHGGLSSNGMLFNTKEKLDQSKISMHEF